MSLNGFVWCYQLLHNSDGDSNSTLIFCPCSQSNHAIALYCSWLVLFIILPLHRFNRLASRQHPEWASLSMHCMAMLFGKSQILHPRSDSPLFPCVVTDTHIPAGKVDYLTALFQLGFHTRYFTNRQNTHIQVTIFFQLGVLALEKTTTKQTNKKTNKQTHKKT